ncbi:MAG: NVEALA domain-containing protein [Bacteroidaceae bacterium]|nr:NVEALA domain-containing protein [Bacteroidaceae bacterium]
MKKLILKSALTVVTAALTGLCGVKAYEKYQTSKLAENTLLMQNIEALTQGEGEGDDTSYGCSGSPIYLYSELCQGTTQLRIHWYEKIDQTQNVKYKRCVAYGDGSVEGIHYSNPFDLEYGEPKLEKCLGSRYHINVVQ